MMEILILASIISRTKVNLFGMRIDESEDSDYTERLWENTACEVSFSTELETQEEPLFLDVELPHSLFGRCFLMLLTTSYLK